MSDDSDVNVNVEGHGCMFLIGIIIVAICVGNIYTAVHGWLAFGAAFVLWALLTRIWK